MASIRVKYRASRRKDKPGTLYYQVIHSRIIRQVKTEYRLFPEEWDDGSAEIRLSTPENSRQEDSRQEDSRQKKERREELLEWKEKIAADLNRLDKIVAVFNQKTARYTADDVVFTFQNQKRNNSLFTFMQNLAEYLRLVGRVRTSETYATTLNSFRRFRKGKDVMLDEVDGDLMAGYEAYLKAHDVSLNTISFYMRILRAMYNRAVEKGLTPQQYPFKHVYTGIEKTVKRAVPLEVIRQIKRLDLEREPSLAYARDLFMFSFYTRGMSFVDMAFLEKKDLKNGVLSYRRKKTGQRLLIEWEGCMQRIVEKYPANNSPYLLPIILRSGENERMQYKNASHLVNRKLKEIAERIGLSFPLTMYVARHSWASIARSKRIPLSVISEGMGHDSEATTLIYLTSLNSTAIDRANRRILNDL